MIDNGTRSVLLLAIALVANTNNRFVQSQEQQLVAPETNATYDTRIGHHLKSANTRQVNTSETLETAPTITSVHQVWTSSSSGRLDELSPEVISKLRQDVPFLAAYALRPRLVGASQAPLISHLQAVAPPETGGRLDVAASNNGDPKLALAVAASSARQQLDSRSPVGNKLATGDFSEYNEETSSLSKSEHHHRRKTSVKRARPETSSSDPEDGPLEFSSSSLRRRRVSSSSGRDKNGGDSLNQLVNRLKQRSSGGKARATSKANKVQRAARRSGGRAGKGGESRRRRSKSNRKRRAKATRQRRASKRLSGTSKSGRLLQTKVNEERTATGGDVKGGGGPKKPAFYASTRPDKGPSGQDAPTATTELPSAIEDNKVDSEPEIGANPADDAEIDEEPREVEPKRVGDDDVEEDIGDTVLVEPKSDGVDDDPPLPDSPLPDDDEDDEAADDDASDGDSSSDTKGSGSKTPESGDREKEVTTPMPKLAPEGDPRGNRVNRQKPNQPPPADGDDDDSDADNSGGGSQVTGGGIGTTLGGGGASGADGSSGDSGASDSGEDDDRSRGSQGGAGGSTTRGGGGSSMGVTPGVEFAGDRDSDDERTSMTSGRDGAAGGSATGGSGDGGQFGDRRLGGSGGATGANGSRGGGGSATNEKDDDDDDLDYRDEMAEAERKGSGGKVSTAGGHPGDDGHNQDGKSNSAGGRDAGHDKTASEHDKSAGHGRGQHHCDDGSYNHDHDHGGGHHSHHDTIEWLRGSIPGEPDDDYPILSRVNATNFRCADQKLPGYYADVDARCQIFHICQADGRQDSFLCPNGTIFSQRTLVCVWWNGFKCEDAPKYYHLNELLYKTTNGDESPQAAALPGAMRPLMTPLRPKGMRALDEDNDDADDDASMMAAVAPSDDGDDTSPIDGLVRAMRGRGESTARDATGNAIGGAAAPELSTGTNRAVSREGQDEAGVSRGYSNAAGSRRNLDDEDEATIQRKSTSLDEDDADEPPARLRARDNIRRRRRRASTRQAPPKLKSRRVSRNSRRRKLRHGVKPRRRA